MRRRSAAVLTLGIATLASSWAFGSRPLALVAVGLLAAGVASRLWARWARAPVALERRTFDGLIVEGRDARLDYRVESVGRLPLGSVHVRERIGVLGEFETRLRRGAAELTLNGVPRGRYPYSAAEVVIDDPLGLERVVHRIPSAGALVVVPRIVDLESPFSEAGAVGAQGRRVLLRRPSGVDLHSVREYEQGESLRKVHWPTTARRGRLMVKELEDSPRDDLLVLLDCDAAGVAGEPGASSFDEQVRATGSLLRAYAASGKRAGLASTNPGVPPVRASSLEADWKVALQWLAAVEPDADRPLARVLADDRSAAARAGELVVVTAALEERAGIRLLHIAARGRRVSVVHVDAATYAGRRQSAPSPALLRLSAAGVPVAVIRRGDDLRQALSYGGRRSASA